MSAEELKIIEEKVDAVVNEQIQYPELKEKYMEWAELYEQDMNTWGYKSPLVAAREVSAILGNNKDARVLDVCAGTGMTGKAMYDAGYTNLEAFDGNPGMLEKAKEKKVYKAFHIGFLGDPINLPDNSFDMVTLFGALCDGHVNPDSFACFKEFTRIIKPGGHFIGGTVMGCLKDGYRQKVESAYGVLESEGLWEKLANKVATEGTYEEQVWIYRVK
jgi:ubiquinone/menaquinone biosynthesis C-methylase UbiE